MNEIKYTDVRILIDESVKKGELVAPDKIQEAEKILDQISDENCAQWHYLKGRISAIKGWSYDAQKHFEKARYLDPNNSEYRNEVKTLRKRRHFSGSEEGYSKLECLGDVLECFASLICC